MQIWYAYVNQMVVGTYWAANYCAASHYWRELEGAATGRCRTLVGKHSGSSLALVLREQLLVGSLTTFSWSFRAEGKPPSEARA